MSDAPLWCPAQKWKGKKILGLSSPRVHPHLSAFIADDVVCVCQASRRPNPLPVYYASETAEAPDSPASSVESGGGMGVRNEDGYLIEQGLRLCRTGKSYDAVSGWNKSFPVFLPYTVRANRSPSRLRLPPRQIPETIINLSLSLRRKAQWAGAPDKADRALCSDTRNHINQ